MNEATLRNILANLMVFGVILAAIVMIGGGAVYLINHGGDPVHDHVFKGEPADLREPRAILLSALKGSDPAVIQLGVLLLLFNPMIRVAFAVVGYAGRDWLYTGVSVFVLAMLCISFFV